MTNVPVTWVTVEQPDTRYATDDDSPRRVEHGGVMVAVVYRWRLFRTGFTDGEMVGVVREGKKFVEVPLAELAVP